MTGRQETALTLVVCLIILIFTFADVMIINHVSALERTVYASRTISVDPVDSRAPERVLDGALTVFAALLEPSPVTPDDLAGDDPDGSIELVGLSIPEPSSRGGSRPQLDYDYVSPEVCWPHPDNDGCFTDADVRLAIAGANLTTQRIFRCEAGRTQTLAHPDGEYRPYAIGSLGELGSVQLLPGSGNGLSIFYRWGFTDPGNPYQGRAFVERVQREGMTRSQYASTMNGCLESQ